MNEKFQNALNRKEQNCPPIWFMRQAGRYHSHYQGLRKQHGFVELCKQPELAAEVALGPILDFDFDVSILFSDILFPLEALGMGLKYDPAPQLSFHLRENHLKSLNSVDQAVDFMNFQKQAVQVTRQRLPEHKSLVGFVGGLWTLFSYAVEGSHKGGLHEAKRLLPLYRRFLEKLYPLIEQNIALQFEGGAEVVYIFDTAAGELSPQLFNSVVFPELKKLAEKYPNKLAYYTKNISQDYLSEEYWQLPLAGRGFDHKFDLAQILKRQKQGVIQGNFDQNLLFADELDFEDHVLKFLEPFKELSPQERAGWVCGLGHGILPATPEANVRKFIEVVRREFNG